MWLCEQEKWSMRQNPILSSRLQVGGRPMPPWFSASLVNQSRGLGPTPPPVPAEPPPQEEDSGESEYEEIEHLPKYSNMNMNSERRASGNMNVSRTCGLCGNPNPLVRCEMCNNQIFCGACNDMYHRHPKRHNHTRKLLENLEDRPPLPPKAFLPPQQQGPQVFPHQTPVPPPRRNRRFGNRSATSSPSLVRKPSFDPMGSLKRFVGVGAQRPLPPPPQLQGRSDMNRPMTPTMTARFSTKPGFMNNSSTSIQQSHEDRRHSGPVPQAKMGPAHQQRSFSITNPGQPNFAGHAAVPLTVLEISNRNRNGSAANLREKQCLPLSRDSGYPGWDDEDEEMALQRNQRSYSVSTSNLHRFPTSNSDASHFATLHRQRTPKAPPPVPPRDFSQHQHHHPQPQHAQRYPSASVFELDRAGAFVPWIQPAFEFQQQQAAMMGYPGTLRRAPSASASSTAGFGWGPTSAFGTPMSQSELEMELLARRGSEPQQHAYGNQIAYPEPIQHMSRAGSLRGRAVPDSQALQMTQRVPTPVLPKQRSVSRQDPGGEYYSADPEECLRPTEELTENPEGPWACEHCTFVNTKTTRVCIICCKTPTEGYRVFVGNGRATPANPGRGRKYEPEPTPVVQSKLTFSNSKAQPNQQINFSVEQVRKPPRAKPASEPQTESSESEEEEITQRQRYPFRENGKLKNGSPLPMGQRKQEIPKHGRPGSVQAISKQVSVSTGVGSSPPPSPKFVDSGTGEYSVHEPIRVLKPRQETKPKIEQPKPTAAPRRETGSQSTSTSPFPNRKFAEFDRSSRGTSPPPQTISTQTYEEIPASKMRQKSVSKTSVQSIQSSSRDQSPHRTVEMSDKALRYARRAQQQSKLKRSMSTHLTSTSNSNDPWADSNHRPHHHDHNHHEGRHLYRSSSRHSLASDTRSLPISGPPSRDGSPPRGQYYEDFRRFPAPSWDRFPSPGGYFASIEDLVVRKRRESMKSQEGELSRLLKEAEEFNYTPEDLQTALRMCGDRNPIKWLQENWSSMIETVQTLATKYGRDKGQELNEVGTISPPEAKEALRHHRGNVWAAVTECVDQRRKKFLELQSRGSFLREDILTALTANQGNLDAAYVELSKAQLKPFLMRIWGPPSGQDNEALPPPLQSSALDIQANLVPAVLKATDPGVSLEPGPESVPVLSPLPPPPLPLPEPPVEIQVIETEPPKARVLVLQQVKSEDGDDEPFDDALFDPELASPHRATSLSDPELDESEANVSDFIQNFEVPLAPKSPLTEPTKAQTPGTHPAQMDQVGDGRNNSNSPQGIASLAVALSAISEQLGTLLKHQESSSAHGSVNSGISPSPALPLSESAGPLDLNGIGKVSDSKECNSNTKTITASLTPTPKPNDSKESNCNTNTGPPTPKPSHPIQDNEVQMLKDIYKEELIALKQIVLDSQPKEAPFPLLPQPKTALSSPKSGPSKLYEALGHFAGSFLRRTPTPKKEDNIYETVKVETKVEPVQIPTAQNQNEVLAQLLQEKISSNQGQEVTNLPPSSPVPTTSRLGDSYKALSEDSTSEPDEPLSSGSGSESQPGSDESSVSDHNGPKASLEEILAKLSHGKSSLESSQELLVGENGSESEGESRSDIDMEESYEEEESDNEEAYERVEMREGKQVAGPTSPLQRGTPPGNYHPIQAQPQIKQSYAESPKTVEATMNPTPVPKTKIEIGIQRLLESGQAASVQAAEVALKLMDMNFPAEDSLLAANECSSLYTAISFLQQECLLCDGKFSARQMVSMLRCTHRCCRACASEYFMIQIRDHSVVDCICPFCKEPSNLSEETEQAPDYFSHLDMLLKDLLNERTHEMFQRKLRDWTLAKTPNFKWCSKCSSGFITEPLQTHLVCPDCNAVTCAVCLEPWDKINHNHRDRPDMPYFCDAEGDGAEPKSIIDYLNENCIECPRCHLRFALARGGCMHLTCSQCRYEFCSGCLAPFRMGAKCSENSPYCAKLGLHAHHPRNCLFYLRDKEPESLTDLLKENDVPFLVGSSVKLDSEAPAVLTRKALKCKVPIQKETEEGLADDFCGQETKAESPNICQTHYVEYLGLLIWQNHLDPISILSNDDLETIVKRAHKKLPPKPYGTKDVDYRPLLLKVIGDEIPL